MRKPRCYVCGRYRRPMMVALVGGYFRGVCNAHCARKLRVS